MREVILIAGLPGSGKSMLGTELSRNLGYRFIDDVSKVYRELELVDRLRGLENEPGLILADPWLCASGAIDHAKNLLRTVYPNVAIKIIAFANDPGQCLHNVRRRTDERRVTGFIHELARQWHPAPDEMTEIRAVYSQTCDA